MIYLFASCKKEDGKYKCPNCSAVYCSVHCYKLHGDCSEKFYQKQLEEMLQNTVASEERKNQTLEMLQRLQLQEIVRRNYYF